MSDAPDYCLACGADLDPRRPHICPVPTEFHGEDY